MSLLSYGITYLLCITRTYYRTLFMAIYFNLLDGRHLFYTDGHSNNNLTDFMDSKIRFCKFPKEDFSHNEIIFQVY